MIKSNVPRVTILIAALNAGRFITRAIRSALDQADVELEVLVVDDGSTDDTAVVATCGGDPRVRVISLASNVGPAAARNMGLRYARGEWIAILDADDAFAPGRLLRLLTVAESQGADIVADNFRFYNSLSGEIGAPGLQTSDTPERLTTLTFVERARPFLDEADYGLLKPIFRRGFLTDNRLCYSPSVRHGEDFLLILHALEAGACYVLDRTPSYLYTSRDSGQSRTGIDYVSQVATTRSLAAEANMRGAVKLGATLFSRARALARLSARRRIDDAWRREILSLSCPPSCAIPTACMPWPDEQSRLFLGEWLRRRDKHRKVMF